MPPVATCQRPSDDREMCWGVLFAGGLAPGALTSEVSPPKKRALFVVRAWGLAGALGRRESASGAGVAPAEEKNPLSVSSRLPGLPARGTVDNCWSAWPAQRPGVPWPGRCVLLWKEAQGSPVCPPPPPLALLRSPMESILHTWETPALGSRCVPWT